jgi:hypothetical protein
VAYAIWESDELREEARKLPVEVRMAYYAAVMRALDHRPKTKLDWGQLEFVLRDENESFSTAYIWIDDDWIPGYFSYRWEQRGIKIGEVRWPQKLVKP